MTPLTLPRPAVLAALALDLFFSAAVVPAAAAEEKPKFEMTSYQFVMLTRAKAPAADDVSRRAAYLANLVRAGRVLAEGPVEGAAFHELVVFDVRSREEAEALLKDDPLVANGTLAPRVLTWWAAKGLLARPPDPAQRSPVTLGLFVRPADAPDLPQEKLAELQRGHMANIEAMAEGGDLVIAGPFEDGGRLRGVLVFRTTDRESIERQVARDPSVAARRLALELQRWDVAAGTLPPR